MDLSNGVALTSGKCGSDLAGYIAIERPEVERSQKSLLAFEVSVPSNNYLLPGVPSNTH